MTSTRHADELANADYSRPERECDMVMKGGITSGVLYPLAVCKLATEHRLRNIGGASAGAIAAGLAAAAEYARARQGFNKLAKIPAQVGQNLDRLFQPTPATRPAMKVLLAAVEPGGPFKKLLGVLSALVTRRFVAFAVGFVLVGGISLVSLLALLGGPVAGDDWPHLLRAWALPAVLLAVPAGLVTAAISLVRLILKRAPDNYFGLTNGMTHEPDQGEALTPWLHETIENVAGQANARGSRPLTFGDLWDAEAALERYREPAAEPSDDPLPVVEKPSMAQIDLQVMTTDLTEGLPYRMPFEGRRLAFCPACFADLFPPPVVSHMKATAGGTPTPGNDGTALCRLHGDPVGLLHLPPAADFPVVVAIRMSLSFPVLISAVPLYKRDFNRSRDQRNWVVHWFSDGGIGSNFPIHFFDSPWPGRPTYGIDLKPIHPDYPDSEFYRRQQGRRAQPRTAPIATLGTFFGQIFSTMQNWRDRSLAMTPGYSSRIVSIFQQEGEGGINLRMPEAVIDALAERGAAAAEEFRNFSLARHQWERYRISMAELDVMLTGLERKFNSPTGAGSTSYQDFLATHDTDSHVPNADWRAEDLANTTALMEVAKAWSQAGHPAQQEAPRPSPAFRMESRLIESE